MIDSGGKLVNPELRLENTSRCNFHCLSCPREKMTRPKTDMCYGMFCNLVDQGIELGAKAVSIFGYGEPLLDDNITHKVAYCSSHGLETFITTNGSLLNFDLCYDLLDSGLTNIRFSLHALTPMNYARFHRGGDWLETITNLGNFFTLNRSRGNPCKIHITAMPIQGERVEEIRDHWSGYCDFLEIWRPHNWGGGRKYRNVAPVKRTCGRPFSGPVQVQADGHVIPCCFLTNGEHILGNATNTSLYDILTGKKYNELREAHKSGKLEKYPCFTCDQRNVEVNSPLLYSNRESGIGKTSTIKFNVEEKKDDNCQSKSE